MTQQEPQSGFIYGMPNEAYHTSQGISNSGLKLVRRSPAHYRFQAKRSGSRAMEIGTAIHTALLEPERFAEGYVLLKDVTDRRASAYREAIKHHPSERVLTGAEADKVAGMQESAYANPASRSLLTRAGDREVSLFTRDPETGLHVRVRYDILGKGEAVDVKKTQDARPDAFARSMHNYEYHMQAALYLDAYEWHTGERLRAFRFLVVEEEMPHAAMAYRVDDTALMEGRRMYREALNTYADCLAADHWPAYECGADELIGLPAWRVAQIENELLEEIV